MKQKPGQKQAVQNLDMREEVRIFFDQIFCCLGVKLNVQRDSKQTMDLSDYVYARIRKLLA